ncbi:type III secretion system effector XopF1 [Xanthomonas vesicatoria]|uniref:type III secretion system effector XopF1 n=1 Tax=Xanthomonas vesicatoria TaxID=56460 RepID=UPI0007323D3F|nr:type III secretion system effector XopF1 [Xanthomonas vesicatoria]KTF37397.1 hypothetical protein LMG919_07505 [Xanthomonas vesicatoria]MCC8557314.1 hypothetical protein [Xanthomonas vesicatoria]MCC8600262.1 hypothetical protein [Xanthomonas vesicatoria]MCC8608812.1 hypothetical protein [Xanthomonas vesicatoria]MCC8674368.1 hypothetical protein [Xanthomonas vesicatoria]
MKLTRDTATSSDFRTASATHARPAQAEDAAVSQQLPSPSGPLEGLPSPGQGLRDRRAPFSRRVAADADRAGSSLGGSQRSHLSPGSNISDASFYSARMSLPSLEVALPEASDTPGTHAEHSAQAVDRGRAQMRVRLGALPFAEPSQEQEALQAEYLAWADARLQERVAAFGPDAGYQVVGDMKAVGAKKAALPIAYECLRAFVIGAMRNPFGAAASVAYDDTREPGSESLSTATLFGAVAGLVSYTSDTLLIPAMDRRARVANLPRFQAIDSKILVPDPPPVLVEITDEGKRFTRLGEGSAATLAELKVQMYDLRTGVTQWQSTLDDKSLDTLLLKPTINAGFSAARRTSDDPGTRTPAGQLALSALVTGGAGVVQKAMLETGKAVARTGQMTVPDLLGGQQRLNLFSLALPDKERRPAQWSDAAHFPSHYLVETGKETLALAKQALSTTNAITTAVRDVLVRHMLGNVLTNLASLGAGRLIAAPLRGGNESGSVTGEAANSTATVVQQAAQTLFNDTIWNALKARNGANTTQATRLDQERAVTAARYQRTIARTLQSLAEPIDTAIALFSDPTPAQMARALEEGEQQAIAPGPLAVRLRESLEQLRVDIGTRSISIATIDSVRARLRAGHADRLSGVPRNDLTKTLDSELKTLKHALQGSEELRQWENGRP